MSEKLAFARKDLEEAALQYGRMFGFGFYIEAGIRHYVSASDTAMYLEHFANDMQRAAAQLVAEMCSGDLPEQEPGP